jgi:hypothetical protein
MKVTDREAFLASVIPRFVFVVLVFLSTLSILDSNNVNLSFSFGGFGMTQETATLIQAISSALSCIAAIIAIFIALRVENRTNQRFSQQLQREETLAIANIKPLLAVYPSKFLTRKAITLSNYGLGTAIITAISFSKGNIVERKAIMNLFSFAKNIVWDYYWIFRENKYYVQAGQKIKLLELTHTGLSEDGLSEDDIEAILSSFQQQMEGLTIRISYEDILGNKQVDYEIRLTA